MKTIYKYPLQVADEQQIEMPMDAQLLDIQVQNSKIVLWALVNTDNSMCKRTLIMRGTGHKVGYPGPYIATIQYGALVLHVFDEARS